MIQINVFWNEIYIQNILNFELFRDHKQLRFEIKGQIEFYLLKVKLITIIVCFDNDFLQLDSKFNELIHAMKSLLQ